MHNDNTTNRRIGLLGGSFNPAHDGHREISLAALKVLALDVVWWLVSPGNPLKDATDYASYEDRLIEARAVSNHPDIVVSDFERRHSIQYTVETLSRIKELNASANFVWLMGADSLATFHHWRDWMKIAEIAPMAVFNRPGYGKEAQQSEAAKTLSSFQLPIQQASRLADAEPPAWIYVSDTDNPISSTEIRSKTIKPNSNPDATRSETDRGELQAPLGPLAYFLDLHPDLGDFRTDVLGGLVQDQKWISPKYFYDERGSKLFNRITQLKEYYPTRTEKNVFETHEKEIIRSIGRGVSIFEYGSGSSEKIEWLARGVEDAAAYVAMDISREHLLESATALAGQLPLPVAAVCADFHAPVVLPQGILPSPDHWLGYFPGSTIGNMLPETAAAFLSRAAKTLGDDAQFLIGVDLVKERDILEAAYNDDDGVTAAFNLNLLARMQSELGADLDMEDFEHDAFYNETAGRIEMHLRARRKTSIALDGQNFVFEAGESLHTENSHKFTIEKFENLVNATPWRLEKHWTDANHWYAACLLSNN
ncbi:L-histidine N(alpha)-methyltransferase [Hyphococcus sp.]|uniref:L-histidine N(alpha)-methyltransferase n=1 Tax=Hyphococcus sp. TaxID=2038636 RepID=UPI003CCC3A98